MTSAGYAPLLPHINSGALRALATSKKVDELPEVPTYAEVGYPEILVNWHAFFAPAKIPKGVNDKLVRLLNKTLENPYLIANLKKAGYVPEIKTPREISDLIKNQFNLVSKITKGKKLVK